MNLFYRAFNTQTLAALGIQLAPFQQRELIERLADTFRDRLQKIVEQRLGRPVNGADEDVIRAYFPDYQGVMQTECMRLFQEVEEHADEIMDGEWRMAA